MHKREYTIFDSVEMVYCPDVEIITIKDDISEFEDEDSGVEEIFSQPEPLYVQTVTERVSRSGARDYAVNTDGAIDLTASVSSPPAFRRLSSRGAAQTSVLAFEEEYDEIIDSSDGRGFPTEEVAELLLKHPDHWWCR